RGSEATPAGYSEHVRWSGTTAWPMHGNSTPLAPPAGVRPPDLTPRPPLIWPSKCKAFSAGLADHAVVRNPAGADRASERDLARRRSGPRIGFRAGAVIGTATARQRVKSRA